MGGQSAVAIALKTENNPITQAHVWKWMNTTKHGIPAEYVIKACEIVDYKITPNMLRPDLYPHENDGLPAQLRKKEAA